MISTCYYCRPSDNLTPSATLSLTAGTEAGAFPLTNAQDRIARTVFKSTGTSCTIRSHWSAPVTIEGLSLHYHKLAGATVTVTNPAGFSRALTIPANTADGHCLDPWDDYRTLANVTDDDWDIVITGAATVVAIGEIVWWQTVREAILDRGAVGDENQPAVVHAGDYHPRINAYRMGTRVRAFRGHIVPADVAADILTLSRGAQGVMLPFALVPDSTVNDALFGHLATTRHTFLESYPRGSGARETDLEFAEALRGLAL